MDQEKPSVADEDEENEEDEGEPVGQSPSLTSLLSSQLPMQMSSQLAAPDADLFRPGSNNWVVSGQHTVTGKPLLSNDCTSTTRCPTCGSKRTWKSGNFDVARRHLAGHAISLIVGHTSVSAGASPTSALPSKSFL